MCQVRQAGKMLQADRSTLVTENWHYNAVSINLTIENFKWLHKVVVSVMITAFWWPELGKSDQRRYLLCYKMHGEWVEKQSPNIELWNYS